jgi:hypothetical protein
MIRRLLVAIIVMGLSVAATQPAVIQVMVNVKSIFELSIDRNIIDFKTMLPGEVKRDMPDNEGLKVNVKSNNGRPWFLKISDLSELSNGSDSIPNSQFSWSGYPADSAHASNWAGNGKNFFSLTPILAYSSHPSEYNNYPTGTDMFFKFALKVPAKQNSGVYRSVIAFTLTE